MQLKDETRMLRARAADLAQKSPMTLAAKPGVVIDLVNDTLAAMEKMAAQIDAMKGAIIGGRTV